MTINPVPSKAASFFEDLQNFLEEEDADRYKDMFDSFIVSGGLHSTVGSLTATPSSLIAYPGGHYITETGSITYPDNTTHIWVICHKDTTSTVTDWDRIGGTHYLIRNTGSGSTPTIPVDTALLMKVTTAGGAVTNVDDHRVIGIVNAIPNLPGGGGGTTTVIAASVHRNEIDQTGIVTATWTKLALTTERFDKENKFDSATNYRWLPGVTGLARVTAQVAWVMSSGGGVVQIAMYKNGTEFLGQNYVIHATAGIQNIPPLSLLFDITSASDYFEIWVRQDTGINQDIDGDSTRTYVMFEMK